MRTHFCGLVDEALIGQTVTLCGWADVARNMGQIVFIDLRDHEGIVQVVAEPADAAEQTAADEPVAVEEAPIAESEPVPEPPTPETIEPAEPTPAPAPVPEPASSVPAPAPVAEPVKRPEPEPQRHAGRISTAFSLIGRGFRTLFTGR